MHSVKQVNNLRMKEIKTTFFTGKLGHHAKLKENEGG